MTTLQVLIITGAMTVILMAAIWLLSLKLRDTSIVDIYWGPGFAIIAWTVFLIGNTHSTRSLLIAILVTIWSVRLSILMIARHLTKTAEDPRYAAMRERGGDNFAYTSLLTVFGFQALLMWLISLPIQLGQLEPMAPNDFFATAMGTTIFLAGLAFETVSDQQLAQFKADPENQGRVLDTGLWAWSRHPNYFGEILVWWGLYVVALSNSNAWWTIIAPILLTFLIVRVSGGALLDGMLSQTKPGYDEYMKRTSTLIPRPPQQGGT